MAVFRYKPIRPDIRNQLSRISRTSIGQALTQMPQAMHFEAAGAPATCSITPNGQASTHLPHAGLRILGDRTVLTGRSTLAALDAGHRADLAVALNDLQAGLVLMELFIKCGRAGADALQTCHARNILLDEKFLHFSFPFGW